MSKSKRPFVVIRTYSAGVHCGYLVSRKGKEVKLSEARRVWRWYGANSLSQLAADGCAENSNISVPVSEIVLTEAIEIISTTTEAEENLKWSRWTE